jgi:hypothetical protein
MLFIPRIFHRIWLGNQPMPAEFEKFGQTWLYHHPGWVMHTWTDVALQNVLNRNAVLRSASLSGVANILRYEILFHLGGIYIDTDFECLQNVENLLQGIYCFVGLQTPELANNAIMGAIPHHPFIEKLVDGLSSRVSQFSQLRSIKQSGPYYLTEQLRGRSDVTIFPPALFYPYQWHERWRRYERFSGAYAVHHWSLSWRRKAARPKSRLVEPKLSVMLINITRDVRRLEWAIEGLREQRAPELFEVVVIDFTCIHAIRQLTNRYNDWLHITYLAARRTLQGTLPLAIHQRCMSLCSAPRVLLLDGHCVADPDVVDAHLRWDSRPDVVLGYHRIYPPQKMYDFVPPVDYDAFKMHSFIDPRCTLFSGRSSESDLREFLCCCVSVPNDALKQMPLKFDRVLWRHARRFVGELSNRGHRLVVMPNEAFVTWLAS